MPSADGAQAVTIAIAKKEGSNGVTVANAVLDKLEMLQQHLIPSNVQVEVTRNYGKTANDKVNELLQAHVRGRCHRRPAVSGRARRCARPSSSSR